MLLIFLKIFIPFFIILNLLPVLIWLERKGSAYIQDRRGPNRATLFGVFRLGGLVHSLSDVVKLFFKEDIVPSHVHRFFYILAPFLTMTIACVTYAVIPFADSLLWNEKVFSFQAADLDGGVLYILALSSLGVFGVMLAGWSSNNKFALLGGLRSSAQMISYEIVMGLAVLTVVLMSGSLQLNEIVLRQGSHFWNWNFIRQPIAFLLFLVAMFAETNRLPFDLPEGESEIVAGYHVEYSSIKFAIFMMSEYLHMIVVSALLVTLFFGGWQVPFFGTEALREKSSFFLRYGIVFFALLHFVLALFFLLRGRKMIRQKRWGDLRDAEPVLLGLVALLIFGFLAGAVYLFWPFSLGEKGSLVVTALIQFLSFMLKVLFFCWFFIWVRWTLPRFRYDQLMKLGWKRLIPIGLVNLAVTALLIVFNIY